MTCTKCPYECLTCSSSNLCTSCVSGYNLASVNKTCGRDQGIRQLPLIVSFINSTRATCPSGNFSYFLIPAKDSLSSTNYSSQNGLNIGNISIVF